MTPMLNKIEKRYVLRTSDFTPSQTLRVSGYLDLFQDIAGIHSKTLGCGLDDFLKKNIAWVIIGLRYHVIKPVPMYTDVVVETWPLKPTFAKFCREYVIKDLDGDTVAKGDSLWTIISRETRKIVHVSDVYSGLNDIGFLTDTTFEDKYKKANLPDDDKFTFVGEREIFLSDLDMNAHVNNTRYARFATDSFGNDFLSPSDVQIDFHKELVLGQKFSLYTANDGSSAYCKGMSDGELAFTAKYVK